MIKLQIVGNLGKDCIVKEINGKNVINFSVAHTEKFKDSTGAPRERTTWVECAYWTDRTSIAQYLKKGQLIYAEGTPEAEGYLNKDNQNAASLKMRVFQIQLLGGKNDNQGGNTQSSSSYQTASQPSSSANQPAQAYSQMEEPADDLPF